MANVIQAIWLFRYSHGKVFTCLKHLRLADFPNISSGNLSVSGRLLHMRAVNRSLLFLPPRQFTPLTASVCSGMTDKIFQFHQQFHQCCVSDRIQTLLVLGHFLAFCSQSLISVGDVSTELALPHVSKDDVIMHFKSIIKPPTTIIELCVA